MKKNSLSILSIAAIGLAVSVVFQPAWPKDEIAEKWTAMLASPDVGTQKLSVKSAEAERAEEIKALESVLRQEPTKQNRPQIAAAIQIAGKLRASELSELLLDKIDFVEAVVLNGFEHRDTEKDYISVAALIKMGNVAQQPTLDRLTTTPDSLPSDPLLINTIRRTLYVVVLRKTSGPETARALLEKAIEKSEGEKKQNLEKALKLLIWQNARQVLLEQREN